MAHMSDLLWYHLAVLETSAKQGCLVPAPSRNHPCSFLPRGPRKPLPEARDDGKPACLGR